MTGESQFPEGPMGVRAFARLRGVSHVAVLNAMKAGRLGAGAEGGKIVNAREANRAWATRTDLSKAPPQVREKEERRQRKTLGEEPPPEEDDAGGLSLTENSAREKFWRAREAELRYRTRAGELVEAKQVEERLARVFTACRKRLEAIPSKAKQVLPSLGPKDVATLERLIHEALVDLAERTPAEEAA